MLGFDLSEWEHGKISSTWLKFDLYIFDSFVVKTVTQRAALIGKLKNKIDLREV